MAVDEYYFKPDVSEEQANIIHWRRDPRALVFQWCCSFAFLHEKSRRWFFDVVRLRTAEKARAFFQAIIHGSILHEPLRQAHLVKKLQINFDMQQMDGTTWLLFVETCPLLISLRFLCAHTWPDSDDTLFMLSKLAPHIKDALKVLKIKFRARDLSDVSERRDTYYLRFTISTNRSRYS